MKGSMKKSRANTEEMKMKSTDKNTLTISTDTNPTKVIEDKVIVPYLPNLSGLWAIEEKFARSMYIQLNSYVDKGFDLSAVHPTLKLEYDSEKKKTLQDRFVCWYNGNIACIEVNGTLMKEEPPSRWFGAATVTYPQLTEILEELAEDNNTEQVILKIYSGGGSTMGALPCAKSIAEFAKKKRITAFVDDFCCSGAYLLASQCSRVVSAEGSVIGSIGVFTVLTDDSKRTEALGLKLTVVSSSPLKGAGADGKITDELVDEIQKEIDDWHALFRGAVISGRELTEKEMDAAANGKVFLPDQALELKLIDEVVNFDSLVDIRSLSLESGDGNKSEPKDGGYDTMTAEERAQIIAEAKAEAKAEINAEVRAAEKRAEEAEARATALEDEKTEAATAELNQKAESSDEWKQRAEKAEAERIALQKQNEEMQANAEAFKKAQVKQENEHRIRTCSDWIDRKVSEGRLLPAAVPKLKAFFSTLIEGRSELHVSYSGKDGSQGTLDGQHYDIALEVLDDCLPQQALFTGEMAASQSMQANQGNGNGGSTEAKWIQNMFEKDGVEMDKEQALATPDTNIDHSGVGGLGFIHEEVT